MRIANRRAAWMIVLCTSVTVPTGGIARSGVAASEPDAGVSRLHVNFKRAQLQNGLRIITVEDHSAPVISLVIAYDVGSANERSNRTGFAHLFEHLMFQGSEHVAPGQHMSAVAQYGGNSNAMTGTDSTIYFDSVPANQLDLALFLNADRLRSLNISPANLTKEKEVVKEERRLRIDNQPYGQSGQIVSGLLYDSFAYAHDGIGSMADLDAASLGDIRAFFNTYYVANNLVLVLVGDFDAGAALASVKRYFGDLPARPPHPPVERAESPQKQARRRTVEDPLALVPQVSIAFKTVPGDHPDFFALQVLSAVLQEGHSSRLEEALQRRRELVTAIGGHVEQLRGPSGVYISATLRPESAVDEVERTIYGEIERLQQEPVGDWEIEKAKNLIATGYLNALHRAVICGLILARSTVDFNDPNLINTYLDRINAVTAKDLQRVARVHLRAVNRTVVVTMPKKSAGDAP